MDAFKDLDKCLSIAEIRRRLHLFNLSNPRDWSLFDGIPAIQQVDIMYPEVARRLGATDDEHQAELIDLFGPLSPEDRKLVLNQKFGPLGVKHG